MIATKKILITVIVATLFIHLACKDSLLLLFLQPKSVRK